jgi:hypothetical protein
MPFKLGCPAQQLIGSLPSLDQLGQSKAGNRCRRAAPESAAERNLAADMDHQRWTPAARLRGLQERFFDSIGTAERPIFKTALQATASIIYDTDNAYSEIQADRDAERIEPWTEV